MKTRIILYAVIWGIIVFTFSIESFGVAVNSSGIVNNEPNIPVENLDEYTAFINGKEIHLSKELKLSEVFKTLGDPENMGVIYTKYRLYSWGLKYDTGQRVIIEADAKNDQIVDWKVIHLVRNKVTRTVEYVIPGESRSQFPQNFNEMVEVKEKGNPLCPNGLWCWLNDRKNQTLYGESHFEILEKYDVVGPSPAITIHNGGLEPQKTSGNVYKDVYLTILAPDGKKHISRTSTIIEPYPQILNVELPL